MPCQTNILWEVTDTFSGEPNYSWIRHGEIECGAGEDFTDLAAVRRVKKAIGWNGVPCKVSSDGGDGLILRPRGAGVHQICRITFYSFGSAT